MNWPRLKNIFIIVFLIINIVLLGVGYNSINKNSDNKVLTDNALHILKENDIVVMSAIPSKNMTIGTPETTLFGLDKDLITDALKIGMNNGEENERKLVFIGDSSFEYFDFGNSSKGSIKLDRRNRKEFLTELLRKLGINLMSYREDSYQDNSIDEFRMIGMLPGMNMSYDDIVRAKFNNKGVLNYLMVQVSGITGQKYIRTVIPAYKVLLSGYGDYMKLYKMDLGFKKITGTPEPAAVWRLVTDNGDIYYDAISGVKIETGM